MEFVKKNLFILGILYALIVLILFPKWTVDDAYITFRYADNFAKYGALTWNVGEDPIEGYTGVVLPFTLGLMIKAGIAPEIGSKVIGSISYIILSLLLFLLLGSLAVRGLARSIVMILFFTAPFIFSHVYSGLETLLFSASMTASLFAFKKCIDDIEHTAKRDTTLLALLLFTSLVRPEGILFAGLFVIAMGWIRLRHRDGQFIPYMIRFSLLFLLPSLIYLTWRFNYYGYLLPNTFYAKKHAGLINNQSIKVMLYFGLFNLVIPTVSCFILFIFGSKIFKQQIRDRYSFLRSKSFKTGILTIIIFILIAVFQYARSRLLMGFDFRFFAPYYPIYLLFVGVVLAMGFSALKNLHESKKAAAYVLSFFLIALFIVQLRVNVNLVKGSMFLRGEYKKLIDSEHIPVGEYLKENIPADEWLAILRDVGATPYVSGLKTIDFSGINNETIARGNMDVPDLVEYFFSCNPGAAVISSHKIDEVVHSYPEALEIVEDPRFDNYTLVKKYQTETVADSPSGWWFLFLYVRNDLLDKND